MNNIVAFGIGLITGGGIGAGITYYICKKKLEGERAKIRAEYKEYYARKQEEEDEAKIKHVKVIPDKPLPKEYTDIVAGYTVNEPHEVTQEDLINETENIERMHNELAKNHDKPKILQAESFGEIDSYDCESLTYYVYDKTLVHEDNTLVDDPAFLLGDALERYGWADDDECIDALYVRNYKLQRDLEVIKVFGEYDGM